MRNPLTCFDEDYGDSCFSAKVPDQPTIEYQVCQVFTDSTELLLLSRITLQLFYRRLQSQHVWF